MIGEAHRQSEELAAKAEAALTEGRKLEALELYAKAAISEQASFEETSPEKQRTKSILAVSLVSLLYKARQYDEAELKIFELLASRKLLSWAELQLRELLEAVTDERLLQRSLNRYYTGESVTVSLRGGQVGSGTGPLDLILEKTTGFRNLLYRLAEFVSASPLRTRGNPPKELLNLIQMRAAQPSAGSYRLELKLTEPAQFDLFVAEPRLLPAEVSDTLFNFLHAVNVGTKEAIESVIPDPGYRKALLELTRSLAPTGRRLTEIGIYRGKGVEVESVYLTTALPDKVRRVLPRKPTDLNSDDDELRGVLRAVHLDENWLEITLPESRHERCDTEPDMLDDVVGPMVNHEVIVRGRRRKRQGGVRRLLVDEILLAEPD
jgi:hypothetical protein